MNTNALKRKYGIIPISRTNENIILGSLVWDSPFAKPTFNRKYGSMHTHFYKALLDAEIIKKNELTTAEKELKITPKTDADFIKADTISEGHFLIDFEYPLIDNAKLETDYKFVKSFSFSEIKAQLLNSDYRIIIGDYVEEFKKNKWEKYEDNIRNVYIVTELYFGKLNISIENSTDAELALDAMISGVKTGTNISAKTKKTVKYTFDNNELPFAMKIERLKYFRS